MIILVDFKNYIKDINVNYNERNSLTSMHKITLDSLTCR